MPEKEENFVVGDFWVNIVGFRVKILDWGSEYVWVLYTENQDKVAWTIKEFLDHYKKDEPEKPLKQQIIEILSMRPGIGATVCDEMEWKANMLVKLINKMR